MRFDICDNNRQFLNNQIPWHTFYSLAKNYDKYSQVYRWFKKCVNLSSWLIVHIISIQQFSFHWHIRINQLLVKNNDYKVIQIKKTEIYTLK